MRNCSMDLKTNIALSALYTVTSVSYYQEYLLNNVLTTTFLSTQTTVPYSFKTVPVSLPNKLQVVYKAVVASVSKAVRRR